VLYTRVFVGDLRKRGHMEALGVDGKDLQEVECGAWPGLSRLRIGRDGGIL